MIIITIIGIFGYAKILFNKFKDAINLLNKNDGLNIVEKLKNNQQSLKYETITKQAKNNIAQFPILVSNSIPNKIYSTIVKALEKNYCSLLQVVLSQNNIIDLDINTNKQNLLGRVHSNITNLDLNEELYFEYFKSDLGYDNRERLKRENLEVLKEDTSNEFSNIKDDFERPMELSYMLTEDQNDNNEKLKYEINNLKSRAMEKQTSVLTSEIRKNNELMPTLMEVSFFYKNQQYSEKIVFGVKAVGHLIESSDIVLNLINLLQNNKFFLKLIRWTTGEISFMKDFLLNLKNIKLDVKATKGKNENTRRWFNFLYKKGMEKNFNLSIVKNVGLIPNTTLVLTTDEIEFITSQTGINLLKSIYQVKNIMEKLSLMGFIVIDPAIEVASFFFDGDVDFHHYPFDLLEKETSNGQEYKAMFNILNKIR